MRASGYFAHSGDQPSRNDWHELADHLKGTGAKAAKFLESVGCSDFGQAVGLLHDLGKYTQKFQRRLDGDPRSVDHSTAGAKVAMDKYGSLKGKMLAFCIAGHHAGLADGSGEQSSSLKQRLAKEIPQLDPVWRDEIILNELSAPQIVPRSPDTAGFSATFFIRMLFSALVDADHLDTEAYYDGLRGEATQSGGHPSLSELRERLDQHLQSLMRNAGATEVNKVRAEVLNHVRGQAAGQLGLFTLTVPTGGGKTLTSLAFALDHATHYQLSRIIYVIPYTSIVEQTAMVFRKALSRGSSDEADFVVEHHSSFDEGRISGREGLNKLRLATQNWDAPIVVTTAVQFFESLFADRPSRCRKLHNIPNSVVILDEAQTLPLRYLRPCVAALDELARNWRTTAVLCTATQPALAESDQFPSGFRNLRELAPNPQRLHRDLKRTQIRHAGIVSDSGLVERLRTAPQVLCIVNTRRHARELYEMLRGTPGTLHLSTLMCAAHRRERLDEVRARLQSGAPVRLVATSLVEAGVDLDFPAVWRAEAGLESIIQAAGRCNREGGAETSDVFVFQPDDSEARKPPPETGQLADSARSVMRSHDDPSSLEAIEAYFREVYWTRTWEALDAKNILGIICERQDTLDFPFRTIAKEFNIIESDMVPVIVPYAGAHRGSEAASRLLRDLEFAERPRQIARKLQPYTVQVPPRVRQALLRERAVAPIGEARFGDQFMALTNMDLYQREIGLSWNDPTFRNAEELVV
ncbi:MAG: CRISPR-associated helicase Cas3' [Gammaproteobacteria bacterium]|nr:CRISPR-associated helicase Cas3' [Gammaproteobacteria bacterium]